MAPYIDTVATGKNINRLRIKAGMSIRDLQDIFGFSTPQAIYFWIHGRSLPKIDNLVVLSYVLNVPLEDIIVTKNSTHR